MLELDALATVAEERSFEMPSPPQGERRSFPGGVAATAAVIRWRCEQLGRLPAARGAATPLIDALISRDEPRTGPSGTLAKAVDIDNPATGEAYTAMLEELTPPGADNAPVTRLCAHWRWPATTRAPTTGWRGCYRWTCASSTRRGSA